jgi:glycosyltransferase involved in cell wall biosynthesis
MNFNGSLNLVAVGNLRKPKNYSFLIEAFKDLPKNIHLDIYGAGPLKNELQAAIEKYKVNIRLCGMREDIYNILLRYDAFIMSSIYEGCPISLLEAMACGMPAILSDIPVLREVAGDKSIFFDINKTEDLVRKLKEIAKHEINLDEYAAANFERVKKIALKENYLAMLCKIYTSPEKYPAYQPLISPIKIFNPVLPSPRPFL